MNLLKNLLGGLMKIFYDTLTGFGVDAEPGSISYYAIAILLMALVYKLITIPVTLKSAQSSQKMASIQPKVEELKKKYGYDEQILQQKTQQLYKEENVGAASGTSCLLMIVQMIIAIALYDVIRNPQTYMLKGMPEAEVAALAKNFFWIPNLELKDTTMIIAIINSLSQLLMTKLSSANTPAVTDQQKSQNNMMLYMMPIMFFFIFKDLPSGLVLYWSGGNVIDIIIRFIKLQLGKKKAEVA